MDNLYISPHFSYREMTASTTAVKRGLDNTPSESELNNLKKLCSDILEPIRLSYGKPIVVTSGFRSKKVNIAVGGANNSDHLYGAAADIRSLSGTYDENLKLWKVILKLIDKGEITARQVIDEKKLAWIHVSVNNSMNSFKKNQILHL